MSSFLAALLLGAGKSFGEGALSVAGSMVASMVLPIIIPKVVGVVKGFTRAPEEECCDPDLC